MPASAVFENLEAGAGVDDIVEQFDIAREQINAFSRSPPAVSTRRYSHRTAPRPMLIPFDHVTPRGVAQALLAHPAYLLPLAHPPVTRYIAVTRYGGRGP